jgi:hypothetical protein
MKNEKEKRVKLHPVRIPFEGTTLEADLAVP